MKSNLGVVAAWALAALLFAVGSSAISGFASRSSIVSMLVLASFLGVAAAGQNLTILLGGIDLSIPYVITMGDVLVPLFTYDGFSLPVALVLILALAAVVGTVNGWVSSKLRLHPLIVTLGMGYVVYGALLVVTKAVPKGSAPQVLTSMVSLTSSTLGLPIPPVVIVWVLLAIALLWALRSTAWGRGVYEAGANPRAAEIARLNVGRIWSVTYALSAMLAAVTGILLSGFSGQGNVTIGASYLFLSVGAVVVGGTTLLGGSGSYLGTIAGALALTELSTVLVGFNVGPSLLEALYGSIIVIGVLVYGREAHVRSRV
ncbi:MAG: ABC transporter permease [Acidimicrobiales bacterium]